MEINELMPLKFRTIFKEKIWGGQKIKEVLGKDFSPLENCGETWELSGVHGNVSIVEGGPFDGQSLQDLLDTYQEKLVGKKVFQRFGNEFPLLIKFIDAAEDLSIQVHPNDELAKQRHNSFGKTEMWYILQADPEAVLITGFNQVMSKDKYLEAFNEGKLEDILNKEVVEHDDVYFIPAGRVHTIGKGCLLAEIQQTSDVTYRIYDFDRKDKDGNLRELHVEEALDAIDYNFYDSYVTRLPVHRDHVTELASCPYFTTNRLAFDETVTRDFSDHDSFVCYICVEGAPCLTIGNGITMKKGDVWLIPATIGSWSIETVGPYKLLETFIP